MPPDEADHGKGGNGDHEEVPAPFERKAEPLAEEGEQLRHRDARIAAVDVRPIRSGCYAHGRVIGFIALLVLP